MTAMSDTIRFPNLGLQTLPQSGELLVTGVRPFTTKNDIEI